MTDRTYLKLMVALGEDLERAAAASPYDPDAYNKVIKKINRINKLWWRSRRRRHWFAKASLCFLIVVLAWAFYKILHWLEI